MTAIIILVIKNCLHQDTINCWSHCLNWLRPWNWIKNCKAATILVDVFGRVCNNKDWVILVYRLWNMSLLALTNQEVSNINETLLDNLITDLGLKDQHLVPDPSCFICRHVCHDMKNAVHRVKKVKSMRRQDINGGMRQIKSWWLRTLALEALDVSSGQLNLKDDV